MLEQKRFRSLAAHAPWAIFGILPPFAATAAMLVPLGILVVSGESAGLLAKKARRRHARSSCWPRPQRLAPIWYFFPWRPFCSWPWSQRHRLSLCWALVAVAIPLLLFLHSVADSTISGHPGIRIGVGMAPIFLPKGWNTAVADWPIVTAQYVLALLPLSGWRGGVSTAR